MYRQPTNNWGAPVGAASYLGVGDSGRPRMNISLNGMFDIWARLFEPFVTREQGRYTVIQTEEGSTSVDVAFGEGGDKNVDGSVMLGVRKLAISMFLEMSATFLLVTLLVGTVAGAFASGAHITLIGLLAGFTHAFCRYASVAARYTPHLPRHLDPGFTWYAICRGEIGIIIGVFYMISQYGGASLAMLFLGLPGLHMSDAWVSGGIPAKFGAGADLSRFGLFALYTSGLTIIYFVHGFGQTFTSQRYAYARRYVQVAGVQAATVFALHQFFIHVGIFTLNPVTFYAGAVGGGTQIGLTGSWLDWGIIILFAPLAAGPLAALCVRLLWNVNALNRAEMNKGYMTDILAEAGGNGGAPHTAAGRGDVDPNPAPAVTAVSSNMASSSATRRPQQQNVSMVSWLLQDEGRKLE